MKKKCIDCLIEKESSDFCKNNHASDGLEYKCRECHKKLNLIYRTKNKEILEKKRKVYREENKEKLRVRRKELYLLNISKKRENRRRAYNKNIEKNRAYNRSLYQKNRESMRNRYSLWRRKKYSEDVSFRLRIILRNRIRSITKGGSLQKSSELFGCSVEFLKKYIESQFKSDMNWNNYGRVGWHIDHIIPCAMFDLSNSEQQKACFHYTNLQPLWAVDNLRKKDKILVYD